MAVDERDVKINLAKEKLKKFQQKKNATLSSGSAPQDGHLSSDGASRNFNGSTNGSVLGQSASVAQSVNDSLDGASQRSSPALAVEASASNGRIQGEPPQQGYPLSSDTSSKLRNTIDELVRENQLLRSQMELERSSVESQILGEHQSLREKLNNHIQTIGVLVAEKTELQAALSQMETTAKKKAVEVETLNSKLSRLHEEMSDKERSLNSTSVNVEKQQERFDEISSQLRSAKETNQEVGKALDQSRNQLLEANRKLELREKELRSLRQYNSELDSQLQSTKNHLEEQLKSAGQEANSGATAQQTLLNDKRRLEIKLQEYQAENNRLQNDMEEMVTRYQALLQQNSSIPAAPRHSENPSNEAFLAELGQLNETIAQLKKDLAAAQQTAEQSRAQLVGQSQQSQRVLQEREALDTQLQDTGRRLESLSREKEQLAQELRQVREAYQAMAGSMTDQKALMKAVESDKVALSRAMVQNKELKERLQELTDQLESARASATVTPDVAAERGREVQSMEVQTEAVEPPSPLTNGFSPVPLEPHFLKAFEVKIRNLEDEVQMYKNRQIQGDSEVIYLKNALRIKEEEGRLLDLTERIGAYKNLEHKFIAAMKQNADLSEHIDQLEHVIMQLQGETETIGDYIALYQNQRNLQRQRDLQKNAQIASLQLQHQQLKDKVAKLHGLLEELMGGSEVPSSSPHHLVAEPNSGDVPDTAHEEDKVSVDYASNGIAGSPLADSSLARTEEASVHKLIRQVLRDIEAHVSAEEAQLSMATLPTSPHSFLHHGHHTSTYPLQCSCCTGTLMVV
ncbi:hypothetical protein RvY_11099 [Ramazzottius varieornatus]|uniref:Golgin subfamily A conserved domain-containing protein n=1 Tax=Ramazzottius varieornatus TaxID=947166 RepID=A0A1D1VEZ8_RAMVA|nr:hypothetical protein RvY_11099 [Ramazzottius varieornatus]